MTKPCGLGFNMTTIEPMLGTEILSALKEFINATKLHPVLVNFTAALVPVSVFSDFAGRVIKNESLRNAAWWTLFYATVITPFTAITGWLFWMADDNGVAGIIFIGALVYQGHLGGQQVFSDM